jgi:spermidine synthase
MGDRKARAFLIYLLFFFSGVSGLIYEVVWVRIFGNLFGNTIYSASIVTSVFMLGLGIGSYIAGVWSDRQYARAKGFGFVRSYGRVELVIAVLGLSMALILPNLKSFFGAFASYAADARGWQHLSLLSLLEQFLAAIILMLPATALMGATLSLLIRQLLAGGVEAAGWKIGVLYGFNTAGAALGCFSTDLLLVPRFGLLRTQLAAAALNMAVGLTAVAIGRKASSPGPQFVVGDPAGNASEKVAAGARLAFGILLPMALALFFSGFAAMGMEIVWFRLLSAALGEFRVVFSLLLTVILIGTWLGSLAGGASVRRWGKPAERFMLVQTVFIFSTMLLLSAFNGSIAEAYLMKRILRLPATEAMSWVTQMWGIMRPILAVVGLPALLVGFSFPLANAYAQRLERRVGRQAGGLYLANTLGAVLGALVAGFVLLPTRGSQSSVGWLCAASGLALISLQVARLREKQAVSWRSKYGLFAVCIAVAGATFIFWSRLPANHLVTSSFPRLAAGQRVLTSSEGLNEMLLVIENRAGDRFLMTNGHSMSGTALKLQRYMRAFVHIPLLQMSSPRSVLVICFGVGNTLHAASLYPTVRRLDVVDLSEQILDHAAYFRGSNRDILADKRVSVFVNDGRLHLQMLPPAQYDLITLEPPPITFAGVSSLYSREFYELARSRLRNGGFLTQWLPLYQVSPAIGLSMVRAFLDVFPNAVLLSGMEKELIIVGRKSSAFVFDPAACSANLALAPQVQADLGRLHMGLLTEIVGTFVANSADLEHATFGTAPVTDDNRSMEYGMLSKFGDTGLARGLFHVEGVAGWCPDCFVKSAPRPALARLGRYLAALNMLYQSDAFLFFRNAWGAMAGSDIDFLDRDGSLGTVVSRYPYLREVLASPLTGSLEKIVARSAAGPWSIGELREIPYPDAATNIRMAMKLLRCGRLRDSLAWFRRAVDLDGNDASARFGLGYALFYAGDYRGAQEQYRRGLAIAPENIEARLSLASAMHGSGMTADEVVELRQVLLLDPECSRAADRLGRLLKAGGI